MKIIWIASYPKSGNTWMRAVLTCLQHADEAPSLSLNRLAGDTLLSRSALETLAGLDLSALDEPELERLWPSLYRQYVGERTEPVLIKSHDCWRCNDLGTPIFPPELSRGVLHIVRDPRDVCVSWSHFFGTDMAAVAESMADSNASIAAPSNQYSSTVKQSLGSWSGHTNSWLKQQDIPILTLRYEDMLSNPMDCFHRAAAFCGLNVSNAQLSAAIQHCQFSKLQAYEDADAVRWKPDAATRVIRQGQAGGWREALPAELAARIAQDHATVMQQFGYLPESGA